MAATVPYTYDQNHGNVYGVHKEPSFPSQPPSWGFVPTSLQSTTLPSSTSYPSAASQDASWPTYAPEAEYKDPKAEAKEQLKKIEKKERRSKQKKKDAKSATEWLLFLGIFNAVMWAIPVFGTGWHQKMFNGFGIGFTRIKTSLFSIQVDVECHVMDWPFGIDSDMMAKLSPEHQVCKIFQHMHGTHSLHKAKDLACTISHQACYIMETIWLWSFVLVFGNAVSALTSIIASMFLYYYWYIEHLKAIRNWAMALYAFSPAIGTLSFATYCIAMPDLGDLPRSWTAMVQMVNAGTGLGEIRPIGDDVFYNKYGWCWYLSYIVILFSLAGPVSWGFWFNRHHEEKQHELAAVNERLEIENAIVELEEKQDHLAWGGGVAPQSSDGYGAGCAAQPAAGYGAGYGANQPVAGYGAGYGVGFGYAQHQQLPPQQQPMMYSGY